MLRRTDGQTIGILTESLLKFFTEKYEGTKMFFFQK